MPCCGLGHRRRAQLPYVSLFIYNRGQRTESVFRERLREADVANSSQHVLTNVLYDDCFMIGFTAWIIQRGFQQVPEQLC